MEYLVVVSEEKPRSWRADILCDGVRVGWTAFHTTKQDAGKKGIALAKQGALKHPGVTSTISSNVSKITTTVSVPPLALCPE